MEIKRLIEGHSRIMFDTAPIIYFIEEHEDFGKITDEIFSMMKDDARYHAFSSVITIIEVLTQPIKQSRMDIVKKYRKFFFNSSNFAIYSIDQGIAEKAAELRAKYGIKTPDAIQFAVGLANNGTLFVTNDMDLKRVTDIDVLVLNEYL